MNDRKQHVIEKAHQLFIKNGFQATSIQDILTYSGISKGTFYNYFSSKNELLIELFKSIYKKMEKERNELLIGQDPSNVDIFIKQIELQLMTNRTNKLITLFEEVLFANDEELKQFVKESQLRMVRWSYERLTDICGEETKPYLLDCAVMFWGILHHQLKYNMVHYKTNTSIHQIVSYSVDRVINMAKEVAKTGDKLLSPDILDTWFPDSKQVDQTHQQKIQHSVAVLKNANENQPNYIELLEFIHDEVLHSKNPRKFLIQSALHTLKNAEGLMEKAEIFELEKLID